mgnify:CR=1 FL=1
MPEILPMSTKHCTVERDGHVVTLTMNRPEAKNALSPDMLVGLAEVELASFHAFLDAASSAADRIRGAVAPEEIRP